MKDVEGNELTPEQVAAAFEEERNPEEWTEVPWSHPRFKTRDEFEERLAQVSAEELEECPELCWWYLSFVRAELPEGERWVGGVFVEAHGIVSAAQCAHMFGINPGGEVAGFGPLPEPPAQRYRYRLITDKDEVMNAGPE